MTLPTEWLLRFAYTANILILAPVIVSLFWSDNSSTLPVFGNVVEESKGLRLLVASLWSAILICSAVGIGYPRLMIGILLLQIVYKSLWLIAFVLPLILARNYSLVPWGPTLVFVPIVLVWPFILFQAWGRI